MRDTEFDFPEREDNYLVTQMVISYGKARKTINSGFSPLAHLCPHRRTSFLPSLTSAPLTGGKQCWGLCIESYNV